MARVDTGFRVPATGSPVKWARERSPNQPHQGAQVDEESGGGATDRDASGAGCNAVDATEELVDERRPHSLVGLRPALERGP